MPVHARTYVLHRTVIVALDAAFSEGKARAHELAAACYRDGLHRLARIEVAKSCIVAQVDLVCGSGDDTRECKRRVELLLARVAA